MEEYDFIRKLKAMKRMNKVLVIRSEKPSDREFWGKRAKWCEDMIKLERIRIAESKMPFIYIDKSKRMPDNRIGDY